jgi:polysaccharide transporter, PST family
MRSFFKSSFWSFLSIGSRTLSALAINKVVAGQFGPHGITLLAHFQNLVTIATTVPNDGINLGLISFLADKKPGDPDYRRYFWGGACWQLLAFGVVLALFLGQKDFYLGAFLQGDLPGAWLGLFFLGLALLLLVILLQAILLSRQALPAYAALVALPSVASAALFWYFGQTYPLPVLLLGYLGCQGLLAGLALALLARRGWLPAFSRAGISKPVLAGIGKFILMALTLVLCSKMVNFYVRDLMIRRFDLYQTGLWQAVVKLSDSYTMVFTSLLGMIYYPRMAALVRQPEAFRQLVRQTFYRVVPAVGLALLAFYALQRWVILLLFDEAFLPAAYLLDYQVAGDFFKMSAWVLSYIITVQARTAFYIILQVAAATLYLALLFGLVEAFGLKGVTMAHCASFGLFLLFNLVYFRKYLL